FVRKAEPVAKKTATPGDTVTVSWTCSTLSKGSSRRNPWALCINPARRLPPSVVRGVEQRRKETKWIRGRSDNYVLPMVMMMPMPRVSGSWESADHQKQDCQSRTIHLTSARLVT